MTNRQEYRWFIDEQATWPPEGRPEPPFGVTQIEVIRSCPLRTCFDSSRNQNYEPKLGYAARVGLAFHRTLESLVKNSLPDDISLADAAAIARQRFRRELAIQESERQARPRERALPVDQARVDRAIEAIMLEAREMVKDGLTGGAPQVRSRTDSSNAQSESCAEEGAVVMEVPVRSEDDLFSGRIDRVERTGNGVRLLDYKSALRTDLPGRYRRQLQLYAYMWRHTCGYWPEEGLVVYPFVSRRHHVDVRPEICQKVADDARKLVQTVLNPHSAMQLATPGEICQVCEYRPWCKPFWRWQAGEDSFRQALDRAYYGFEGEIASLVLTNNYWKVTVRWRQAHIQIVAPQERFPQFMRARVGDRIRALEMRLGGQMFKPRVTVTASSEIWIVR